MKRVEPKRLVFVDESEVAPAMTRAYGWAPRGERAVGSAPGSSVSLPLIAALGRDGVRPRWCSRVDRRRGVEAMSSRCWCRRCTPATWSYGTNLSPPSALCRGGGRQAGGCQAPAPAALQPGHTQIERLWSKVKVDFRRVVAQNKDALYDALGEASTR